MAIKRLTKRHLEVARLLLRGKTQRTVAQEMALSECHLSRICNSPVFREYMNGLQAQADAEVIEQLRGRYLETARKNMAVLESHSSTVRQKLRAAGGILGRTA